MIPFRFSKRLRRTKDQSMDGNMRRFPPWMLAGASSGVTSASSRSDNKSDESKSKHEAEAPKTKAEKRQRRSVKVEERDKFEEPKKVEKRRRGGDRVGRKTKEKEAKPSIGRHGKSPEIIQTVTRPKEEDLTVDDLLSFAQEYVKDEEDQTRKKRVSLSASESMVDVNDESNMRSSQGKTNAPRDPTSEDMINLLLGPFFKKSQQ